MRSIDASTGPWARPIRAMSIPASTIARRVRGSSEAGPMVATIFVRRCSGTSTDAICPTLARRMELLIIRHGLPVRIDDAGGPADPELSEEGHRQAALVARFL